MNALMDKSISKYCKNHESKLPSWCPKATINLQYLVKNYYHHRWKATNVNFHKSEFNRLRKRKKTETRNACRQYFTDISFKISVDACSF